jgi:hypothetical protein
LPGQHHRKGIEIEKAYNDMLKIIGISLLLDKTPLGELFKNEDHTSNYQNDRQLKNGIFMNRKPIKRQFIRIYQ